MLITVAVSGYRSLRDVVLPLERLNVVTGANGSGKSSLYRAVRLLAEVAQGRVIGSLAAEGGLGSTLWAGPETVSRAMRQGAVPVQGTVRRDRVSLKLGFAGVDYGYAIDLGLPVKSSSVFGRDPEIKAEALWAGEVMRRANVLAHRRGPGVHVLEDSGERVTVVTDLPASESMMTYAADPRRAPEVLAMRERMRGWRFYDALRTDRDAPSRLPQVGTRTPVLAADGHDFAAAVQTIREVGDVAALEQAVDDAFPGSAVEATVNDGLFEVVMHQHGLLRPLRAAELSDGTLRYLLLATALLTPRPPALMVLNEPETSLHPGVMGALARLIAEAATRSQIVVVTHARVLVDALADQDGASILTLEKEFGETSIPGVVRPGWEWPKR